MRYVIVDTETTGLDPATDQLLEAAFIIDDTDWYHKPLEECPTLHLAFVYPFVMLRPTQFNLEVVTNWANKVIMHPEHIALVNISDATNRELCSFLDTNSAFSSERGKMILAGKNVATFDLPFLKQFATIQRYHNAGMIGHRMIDCASHYWREGDKELPNLETCLQRAGIAYEPTKFHDAYYDALLTGKVIRDMFSAALNDY